MCPENQEEFIKKDECCESACEEKSTKEPEIARELSVNQNRIGELVELIARLEGRLSCVMSSSNPQDCCEEKSEPITDIAKEIREKTNQIENVTNTISDILKRLEI